MTGTSADCRRGVMEGKREKGESRFDFSIIHIFNKFYQEPYGTFNTKNFSKIFGKTWVVFKLFSFIQVLACMNKTLSVRLRGLKNKRKVQLGNRKSGHSR